MDLNRRRNPIGVPSVVPVPRGGAGVPERLEAKLGTDDGDVLRLGPLEEPRYLTKSVDSLPGGSLLDVGRRKGRAQLNDSLVSEVDLHPVSFDPRMPISKCGTTRGAQDGGASRMCVYDAAISMHLEGLILRHMPRLS